VIPNAGSWLDLPGNLTGGFTILGPAGKAQMHIAFNGIAHVREGFTPRF
jgi:hypothetical protein